MYIVVCFVGEVPILLRTAAWTNPTDVASIDVFLALSFLIPIYNYVINTSS